MTNHKNCFTITHFHSMTRLTPAGDLGISCIFAEDRARSTSFEKYFSDTLGYHTWYRGSMTIFWSPTAFSIT
ncbi:hypothetical protein Hanom_Chr09g00801621 [Helianthus anomalus]